MEFGTNIRGFEIAKFVDAYGNQSTVQCSSAIGDYDDAVDRPGTSFLWIGVDDAKPQIMCSVAERLGVERKDVNGWQSFDIPEEVSLTTRMHLNREQVKDLIDCMQRWLDTGSVTGAAVQ